MEDLLVRLYDVPSLEEALAATRSKGVTVRAALGMDRAPVVNWVSSHFPGWKSETEVAFGRLPVSCFVAARGEAIIGFACYDATCRNFLGPMGVAAEERERGIGRALLLAVLHAQRSQGYAYSIVGGVGPTEFYAKVVRAIPIPGSNPGIYGSRLSCSAPGSA